PADRRVLRDGRAAVLSVLRSHPDPDVLPDRHLGWTAPRVRDAEVLHLHLLRLDLLPDRPAVHVPPRGHLRFAGIVGLPVHDAGTELAVLLVPDRVRGEDPDGAGAHVVAGCARRSADRRLGDPAAI